MSMKNSTSLQTAAILGTFALFLPGKDQTLKTLASELGLQYSVGLLFRKHEIRGTYREHNILIETSKKVSGWNDIDYINIRVSLDNPGNIDIIIFEEDIYSKMGKTASQQDVRVNNPKFDKKFIIKCNNETFLKDILDEDIQSRILLLQTFNVRIEKNIAYMEHIGRLIDSNQLKIRIDILIDIISAIESK